MSPKSKLDQIKSDARVHEILASVEFKVNRYYSKQTGQQVCFHGQIQKWFPGISIPTIGQALRELRGVQPEKGPPGRPPKPASIPQEPPTMALDAPEQPARHDGIAEPPKTPQTALSRYNLVRKVDRRTRSVSWGYFDTKAWDQYEIIVGSYCETLREIARLEKLNETVIVGYKNGWPIKLENQEIADEPVEVEGDADNED